MSHFGREPETFESLLCVFEFRIVWVCRGNGGSEVGKSKRGLTNGGLSPKFSEKIGQNSFRENRAFSGLIGAFSAPTGAFSGLIGTDSSAPHSRGEAAKIPPKGPFWAQLAPFGLSPRLLSPRLDFPNRSVQVLFGLCFRCWSRNCPREPDILKTICVGNWQSVVTLLHVSQNR